MLYPHTFSQPTRLLFAFLERPFDVFPLPLGTRSSKLGEANQATNGRAATWPEATVADG